MTSDNEDNIVLQPAVTDSSTQTMSPELKNEQQAAATVNFMHDADGDSFVAASSNAPERQPRVSSSSSGGQYTRRTGQARVAKPPRKAAALDFFGDGTTALHYCYQDSFSDVAPLFDCRIQPHSIRIVFYDTNALKTVLRTRAKDRDADSTVTDDTFAFTYCQKCTPAVSDRHVRMYVGDAVPSLTRNPTGIRAIDIFPPNVIPKRREPENEAPTIW